MAGNTQVDHNIQARAYETIPDLASRCAYEVIPQGVIPRCLRWRPFSAGPSISFKDFFESERVCCVTLQPTKKEEGTDFWKSLKDAKDPLTHRFIAYRGSKAARASLSRSSSSRRPYSSRSRPLSSPLEHRQPTSSHETRSRPVSSPSEHRQPSISREEPSSSFDIHVGQDFSSYQPVEVELRHSSQPQPQPHAFHLDDDSIQRLTQSLLVPLSQRLEELVAARLPDPLLQGLHLGDDSIQRLSVSLLDPMSQSLLVPLSLRLTQSLLVPLSQRLEELVAARLPDPLLQGLHLDDDSIQRLSVSLLEPMSQRFVDLVAAPVAERIVEPIITRVTEKLENFLRDFIESDSCRPRSRSPSPPLVVAPIPGRSSRPSEVGGSRGGGQIANRFYWEKVIKIYEDCVLTPKFEVTVPRIGMILNTELFFNPMNNPKEKVPALLIELFMMMTQWTLSTRVGVSSRIDSSTTIIADLSFFTRLQNEWRNKIHPDYEEGQDLSSYDEYGWWVPHEDLIKVIRGHRGRAKEIICICHTPSSHWITIRIDLLEWHIELYDSLMYQMLDSSDEIIYLKRDRELLPIIRLLPRLLHVAGYWECTGRERRTQFLRVIKDPKQQYLQVDSESCGVYAMMYVDRMVMENQPLLVSYESDYIPDYRRFIGARILNWCRNGS